MKPRIALTIAAQNSEVRARARARYTAALESAGAEVVALQPGADAAEFDGLCLSGGEDIHPERYGEQDLGCETIDPRRDALELELTRRALGRDLPILGICRGFQVLNVAFGGSLVQHVEGHRPADPEGVVSHEISPVPGTLLAATCGTGPQRVNSRHHQVVTDRELARGLRVSARVGEVIEAFESPAHRFVVGVQWHPERTAEVAPGALGVFTAFVAAAARAPQRAGW